MLETVRMFALEQLDALDDAATLRTRHARRYLELAEQTFAAIQTVGRTAEEYERLGAEEGNLRLALTTLRDGSDEEALGRLCAALFFYWFFRGFPTEGITWTRRALAGDVSEGLPAELANELAALLCLAGGVAGEALVLATSSVRRARALGDDRRLLMGLTTFGNLYSLIGKTGDLETALATYQEALEIARRRREEWWERTLLSNIGSVHLKPGKSSPRSSICSRLGSSASPRATRRTRRSKTSTSPAFARHRAT
jgi:tetratricopeptide (TPR) repeat protein